MFRFPALLLVFAVLLGAAPVLAQEPPPNPSVTDQGSNVYLVTGREGPIPNLLPYEEVRKIDTLQGAPFGPTYTTLGPVSPDDRTVLAVVGDRVAFFNIVDGSMVDVASIRGLPLSNIFWIDNDLIGVFALAENENGLLDTLLLRIDRNTGSLAGSVSSAALIDSEVAPGVPVFVAPRSGKVLMALPGESLDASAASGAALVEDLPSAPEVVPVEPYWELPRYRPTIDALLERHPEARRLADFAHAFDPLYGFGPMVTVGARLSVYDLESATAREVTALPPYSYVADVSFSEDGSRFAMVSGGATFGDTRTGGRDGALFSEYIYRDATGNLPLAENPLLQGNALTTLDFNSGEVSVTRAAEWAGGGPDADAPPVFASASWSTDNQTLLVTLQEPGRPAGRTYPIYNPQFLRGSSYRFYDVHGQELRRLELAELSDIEATARFLTPDEVLFVSQDRLDRVPFYYNLRSGELRRLADRAGTYNGVVSTNASRRLVFAYSSFTEPVDFYSMGWDGSALERITWTTAAAAEASQTAQYPVSFTLSDGSVHSGVLIQPRDVPFPPVNRPIVVWQEGGPTTPVQNEWLALVESPFALLPNFGYSLLVVPLYGRYGVGPAGFDALPAGNNFGQVDIDAQAEITAQLRASGWASKVGITGCSYGGYFVTQSITAHPGLYDAGNTMCSLVDSFTEWSRGFASLMPYLEGAPPTAKPEEYVRDSPLYNAGRNQTPLLSFHGTNDFLPVTIMQNFHTQVVNNGVPAKMLKFDRAGHGLVGGISPQLSRAYERYGAQEQLLWFRQYLGQ